MRLKSKNRSKLTLASLLRRRKTDLKKFVSECGLDTYEALLSRCDSLGVDPPTPQEYDDAKVLIKPPVISSQVVTVPVSEPETFPSAVESNIPSNVSIDEFVVSRSRRRRREFESSVTNEPSNSTGETENG